MVPPKSAFVFDPNDPRAPSEEAWTRMSPDERARVVAMLPAEVPLGIFQPEGDAHRTAKNRALDALDTFFRKMGRRVYLSSDLAVYYPDEPRFAPDLLAVLDVEPHERMKWVVSEEGKGLDLVLEVHVAGDRVKDLEKNVERYARLGIPEYFIFDRAQRSLRGYRLSGPAARVYRPIVPQAGRWSSEVLGLDLMLEDTRLRFFAGNAPLLEADELVVRLNTMVDELVDKHLAAEARANAAEADKQRLAARVAELLAEVEKLRR
jgi:Uma2 family endonuclease